MATITSSNAILFLTIGNLYPAPQQIQGFAVDDVYGVEALANAETMMGVDGILSAGFVFVPVRQHIMLQADSASNLIMDQWYLAQQQTKELISATGSIALPAIQRKYTMAKGFMTSYVPVAEGRRVLQPRRYEITWESIIPANSAT